jgi:hypothetical protein
MNHVRRLASAVAAVVIALGAILSGAPTSPPVARAAGPNAVTDWSLISQGAVIQGRPATSAIYLQAIVHVAIYDAVVAIEGGAKPFASSPHVARPASTAAAVAAAAHDVLIARAGAQASQVEAAYTTYLAGISDGAAKDNGLAVGHAAATAVLADRAADHFDAVVPWVQPPTGAGVFEPVAPTTPIDVKLGGVRPFVLNSAVQFRPGPPVALTSAEYAADFAEVKALGRATDSARTTKQTESAMFWSENPMVQWNRTLRELAIARGLGNRDTARLLAMTNVASADSLITCWAAKYSYLRWRPVHAIQRALTDGNPATSPDPAWQSLLVVNHPEYPSGHGCSSGAIVPAISEFFGTNLVPITISSTVTGTSRMYSNVRAISKDIFMARIYGGLHFRSTMAAGFNLGTHVSRYVLDSTFQAIP